MWVLGGIATDLLFGIFGFPLNRSTFVHSYAHAPTLMHNPQCLLQRWVGRLGGWLHTLEFIAVLFGAGALSLAPTLFVQCNSRSFSVVLPHFGRQT